jgi:hypothetical protein
VERVLWEGDTSGNTILVTNITWEARVLEFLEETLTAVSLDLVAEAVLELILAVDIFDTGLVGDIMVIDVEVSF